MVHEMARAALRMPMDYITKPWSNRRITGEVARQWNRGGCAMKRTNSSAP